MKLEQRLALKKICIDVMESNNLPIKSAEALEVFDFENATLDDMVFSFATAIGIDYPELGREKVSMQAILSVSLFTQYLIKLVEKFDKQGVSDENDFNPSALFYNWVRIQEQPQERRAVGSACDSRGSDDWSGATVLDFSRTRH